MNELRWVSEVDVRNKYDLDVFNMCPQHISVSQAWQLRNCVGCCVDSSFGNNVTEVVSLPASSGISVRSTRPSLQLIPWKHSVRVKFGGNKIQADSFPRMSVLRESKIRFYKLKRSMDVWLHIYAVLSLYSFVNLLKRQS